MFHVVESFIELNLALLVYLGVFFLADKVMTNRLAYSKEDRLAFQFKTTRAAAYLFSIVYLVWNCTDVPFKRLHAIHLSFQILCRLFERKGPNFYPDVRFGAVCLYHLCDHYDTTNVLVLMTCREVCRCAEVFTQWSPSPQRVRPATVLGWAALVGVLCSYRIWERDVHWTVGLYMCRLPFELVRECTKVGLLKDHYK